MKIEDLKKIAGMIPDDLKGLFEEMMKNPASEEEIAFFKKMQEIEARQADLPEPEFTKAKRAEPAPDEKVEINSLDRAALEYHRKVMEYEYKTGLQLANMTSFKDGIEWMARKIIEVIDAQGDDNLETIGTIEEICKIKIKQNSKREL